MNLRHVTATGVLLSAALLSGSGEQPKYQVLDGITDHNMTVFPILSSRSYNTDDFLTLDEGIKTGQVIVTEAGSGSRMVRPTPQDGGGWSERPIWPVGPDMAQVNELRIINRSDRPLILLAGEIVTGGKQDRIVGKDRIVPAHSDPVSLDVFCVEPHRWAGASSRFHSMAFTMAQPSIRTKAAGEQDQTAVWDEVAHARRALAIPAESNSSSSYAAAMTELSVQSELNSFASDKLQQELQAKRAVGAVIAINKRLVWADVFASSDLFAKYWPKLLRSYSAEALTARVYPTAQRFGLSREDAQQFLDHLPLDQQSTSTDPGVYRSVEITGQDFRASELISLLPGARFLVHLAKMRL